MAADEAFLSNIRIEYCTANMRLFSYNTSYISGSPVKLNSFLLFVLLHVCSLSLSVSLSLICYVTAFYGISLSVEWKSFCCLSVCDGPLSLFVVWKSFYCLSACEGPLSLFVVC